MLIRSANSTLVLLDVSDNPMDWRACKAIELELVLCQLRNPTVTDIYAADKGFDDQDAIKIGQGLRCLLHVIPICLGQKENFIPGKEHSLAPPGFFVVDNRFNYATLSFHFFSFTNRLYVFWPAIRFFSD